jgi:hypothetical protein
VRPRAWSRQLRREPRQRGETRENGGPGRVEGRKKHKYTHTHAPHQVLTE